MKVILKNLVKRFGSLTAVKDLNLEIQSGEFFSLLGPSGCGKTTTLRMIAGLEFPTEGQIFFDQREVTRLPPDRRNTGMVFQNYALFPHMTVFENVAFGLQARKWPRAKIKEKVARALELVDMTGFEARKVTELSGGQQQRVALARAIVIEPEILLLDEPLSNLDARLRMETREEIRSLQKRLNITTIYVTHDQDEALAISDRIAVLNQGVCHQVGTPREIYYNPQDAFVAQFVGNSNILKGRVTKSKGSFWLVLNDKFKLKLPQMDDRIQANDIIQIGLRPEFLKLTLDANHNRAIPTRIKHIHFSGSMVEYEVSVNGISLRVKKLVSDEDFNLHKDDRVFLEIETEKISILR